MQGVSKNQKSGALRCWLVCISLAATGCATPDYQHARQQLAAGNIEAAHRELTALAQHAVVPAILLMGDQLALTDPLAAEQFYRQAIAQGDVKSRSRLAKLYGQLAIDMRQDLASSALGGSALDSRALDSSAEASLEQARKSLSYTRKALALGDDSVLSVLIKLNSVFPELNLAEETQVYIRRYLRIGSSNAQYAQVLWWESRDEVLNNAEKIERLCVKLDYREVSSYRSLVGLYRLQQDQAKINALIERIKMHYHAGRISVASVAAFANWLVKKDASAASASTAIALLEMIAPVYRNANYDIARILYTNPNLPDAKRMTALLMQQENLGNWRANELLGELYFIGKQAPMDPVRVSALLSPIQDKSLVAHYYLGLLARDGLLGQAQPDQALDHLLTAARFGHDKADVALAELFWQAKGIARNPVYAYSFAHIAAIRGSQLAQKLTLEIEPSLTSEQKLQALNLSNQEVSARQLLRQKNLACCALIAPAGVSQ